MAVPAGITTVLGAINASEKRNWDGLSKYVKNILNKYGPIIDKYRGFIPASVVASRIWIETRGDPTATTKIEKEAGLLQLWPWVQKEYGVTNPYDPEQNLRAGCAHWRSEIFKMQKKLPDLFPSKNFDFWACAQLYTMIGGGACPFLLKKAKVRSGHEYSDLVRWLKLKGEGLSAYSSKFGKQSPKLISWRIGNAGGLTKMAYKVGIGGVSLLLIAGIGYLIYRYLKRG